MTLTPVAERLVVELSLPIFTTYVCRGGDTSLSQCEANALTHSLNYIKLSILLKYFTKNGYGNLCLENETFS